MKSVWMTDSADKDVLTGIATFHLNGEDSQMSFANFAEYLRCVSNIEQEIKNARCHGRVSVLQEIARIEA